MGYKKLESRKTGERHCLSFTVRFILYSITASTCPSDLKCCRIAILGDHRQGVLLDRGHWMDRHNSDRMWTTHRQWWWKIAIPIIIIVYRYYYHSLMFRFSAFGGLMDDLAKDREGGLKLQTQGWSILLFLRPSSTVSFEEMGYKVSI